MIDEHLRPELGNCRIRLCHELDHRPDATHIDVEFFWQNLESRLVMLLSFVDSVEAKVLGDDRFDPLLIS